MKRPQRIISFILSFFFVCTLISAQEGATILSGKLTEPSGEPIIGANVYLDGTTVGTVTNLDGTYNFKTSLKGEQTLVISSIGMITLEKTVNLTGQPIDLETIQLESDAVGLEEVYVTASIARDRETPIAVSSIKPEQIEQKLGAQEFPEVLKSTPGIYATKRGGGFGDADVRIRGFGSNNVAVLINGMPVNGMEDDKVYWSNWAGLADVSRTIQVQRGVGASKIAVPSVGGTINVITKTTDAKSGGNVYYTLGNDGYNKYGAKVSTGLTENNWAATISVSQVNGDGYVEGTPFQGYSYFLNVSKKVNDRHQLALTVFGAPQEHARRYKHQEIDVLKEKNDGHRYNQDWGYLNGKFKSNSTNFYHKPVAILNHYFNINQTTYLSSSLYASYGIGGGGYSTEGDVKLEHNSMGQLDWDKAVAENEARAAEGKAAGVYFQNSYNNHQWFGALSTLKKSYGSYNFLVGADLRYYYGEHWQQADDLLGAKSVKDTRNRDAIYFYNREVQEGGKVFYDNDGEVMWEGLFLQTEYSENQLSAFASVTLSNRSYRRHDFAQYFTEDDKKAIAGDAAVQEEWERTLAEYMEEHNYNSILESDAYLVDQSTAWQHFFGYSLKAGANYNLTEEHNVFVNGGYMERQPIFKTVFQNYKNLINPAAVNEKVLTGEVGYGFRTRYINVNLNAYYTQWNDKTTTGNVEDPDDPNAVLFYNIEGVNARHMGVELDFYAKPLERLEINGMVSVGDWIWSNNVDSVQVFKEQVPVKTIDGLFLKDIHVADAAQTTCALGVNYELLPGFKIGADLNYFDRLYADFELDSRTQPEDEGRDVEQVPDYFLLDMNLYYTFNMGKFRASIYGNMHNVLNTVYIADAEEGSGYYYGYGRTWTCGLKIRF